jgi:hypothetical protein
VKRISLRKWLLLAAMAASVVVAAIPALADTSTTQNVSEGVTQDHDSDSESGDMGQSFEVASSGDNSKQCTGAQGVGNTTSQESGVNLIQYDSQAGDFDFEDVAGHLNLIQADSKADNFEFDGEGAPLTVGGTSETSCEQQANQAGSASG